jgi:hypothetical protein
MKVCRYFFDISGGDSRVQCAVKHCVYDRDNYEGLLGLRE